MRDTSHLHGLNQAFQIHLVNLHRTLKDLSRQADMFEFRAKEIRFFIEQTLNEIRSTSQLLGNNHGKYTDNQTESETSKETTGTLFGGFAVLENSQTDEAIHHDRMEAHQ